MKIQFYAMTQEHCRAVMDIFNYYIENGFAAYPQTRMPDAFFGKFLEMTKGYPAFVMIDELTRETAGFCLLRAYSPFSTFRSTAEISYFIKPEYTRRGMGKAALEKLETEAKKMGICNILAGITDKNEQSLAFHRKNGFIECGRYKGIGQKNGTIFDVVYMQKTIEGSIS